MSGAERSDVQRVAVTGAAQHTGSETDRSAFSFSHLADTGIQDDSSRLLSSRSLKDQAATPTRRPRFVPGLLLQVRDLLLEVVIPRVRDLARDQGCPSFVHTS